MRAIGTKLLLLVVMLGAVVLLYAFAVRPWMLNWGATADERSRLLPGDGIVAGAARTTTRAVTIQAPAEKTYPWIAQLGQNRAGFYSYELLEDLVGAEMPRAQTLLPGAQDWQPGDSLWMYPYDKLHGAGGAPLVEQIPGRALAFATWVPSAPQSGPPDGSWAFVVEPLGSSASRLLVRGRGASVAGLGARAFDLVIFEPMHFVMERRMMEGIRSLAEGRSQPSRLSDAAEILAWAGMFALFVWGFAATLRRERWDVPFAVTSAAALGFLATTLFQPPALLGLPLVAVAAWVLYRSGRGESAEVAAADELLNGATAGKA